MGFYKKMGKEITVNKVESQYGRESIGDPFIIFSYHCPEILGKNQIFTSSTKIQYGSIYTSTTMPYYKYI
jgi:hypothetical protein